MSNNYFTYKGRKIEYFEIFNSVDGRDIFEAYEGLIGLIQQFYEGNYEISEEDADFLGIE